MTIDGLPEALRPHLGLLALPRDEVTKRYDRRLAKYFASYGHPETFLKHQAESFRDADMRDATVLDFGCGFGLIASMFAALGARRVVGIDMDPTMITRGRQLLQEWLPQDVRDRVELRCGDLLASDLTDEGFEVITTIESLSHVQSVSQAIGAIRRWIRPRGRVLVSDGNNRFYLPGQRRRRKIWDAWETSVAAPVRRQALAAAFSDRSEAQIERWVQATVGLSAQDSVAAVRLEVDAGVPPVPAPNRRMVHPSTGYHEERELDPFALMAQFEEVGFAGRLLLPHANYPDRRWNPTAMAKKGLRALYPWTLPAFPGFRLLLTDTRSG